LAHEKGFASRCGSAAGYRDNAKIKPDMVFVNVTQGLLEKHPEGRYYMSHNGEWIDADTDALEAQRKRKQRLALDECKRISGKASMPRSIALADGSAGSHYNSSRSREILRELRSPWS